MFSGVSLFRLCGKKVPKINREINAITSKIARLKTKPIDLFEKNSQNQLSEIAQKIVELFTYAQESSQLKIVLEDLIKNPEKWLITIEDLFFGKKTTLLPYLAECACTNSDNFNRSLTNRRQTVENSIMEFVKSRFPSQSKPINYLSLGGGELLQDFIIIVKLMLAGYSLNVNLVDSAHIKCHVENENYSIKKSKYLEILNGKDNSMKAGMISIEESNALQQFKLLSYAAKEMKLEMNIRTFESIDEFSKESNTPQDILTAIDFDDFYREAFNDTITAQQHLDASGRMFLSVGRESFVFTKTSCIEKPTINDEVKNEMKKMDGLLPKRQHSTTLRIAILDIFNLMNNLRNIVIPYIEKHLDAKEIILTMPHPQEVNFFGNSLGSKRPNLNMSKESISYFLSLFLPEWKRLQINYVRGNRNFDRLLPQYDSKQDLVICYGKVTKRGVEAIGSNVNAIHEKFPHADVFCGMQSYEKLEGREPVSTFACEWVWNSEKQLIEIINSTDNNSRMTLGKLYSEKNVAMCLTR